MKDRIKQVQKESKFTQTAFAERIGISRTALQKLESGENNPSEQTIRAICSEFHVNRVWLETGEGEMRVQLSRDEELSNLLGNLMKDQPDFRHRLITVLLRSTPEEWAMIERKAQELVEEMKKADPQ